MVDSIDNLFLRNRTLKVQSIIIASSLLLACTTAYASNEQFTVTGLYFFGCDGMPVSKIKEALPIHVGEKYSASDLEPVHTKVKDAIREIIHDSPTDVAIVNCGHDSWNLYIGLPARSIQTTTYNPTPKEQIELPMEISSLHKEMTTAFMKLLSEKGGAREDVSKGYSLSSDPDYRALQLELRKLALTHQTVIEHVLKSAVDFRQRMLAAEALGYVDTSREQIDALIDATKDENAGVRNNATRALACIASSKERAALIPADRFIQMLQSGTWTDRNKGDFVIQQMCRQEPALGQRVRKEALQALVEISCWDQPHASGARFLLGRVGNLSEERLAELFQSGDTEAILSAEKGQKEPTAQ